MTQTPAAVIRVGLAQINPRVGDLAHNLAQIEAFVARAEAAGCDLVAFPELTLSGYPPEDLLLRPAFMQACAQACSHWPAGTVHSEHFKAPEPAAKAQPDGAFEVQLARAGVSADMVRLSVGIEDLDDILWDIDQALGRAAG